MNVFIHPTADVQSQEIGEKTRIWQFVVILPGAKVGSDVNICSHCFVESDVIIGDRVTIKSGVQLWDGLRLEDDVFIGPNATFTNDKHPRSKKYPETFPRTVVKQGASIGGGAVILPGITIGERAMIGAGSVVTRSVPPNAIVVGNPARIVGYVDAEKSENETSIQQGQLTEGNYSGKVQNVSLVKMPRVEDMRGNLTVGEFEDVIPFAVKRFFMVFDVPNTEIRGEHAHRACHQFLVCTHGSCSVVADDGRNREEFQLDQPDIGIHLPPMVWGVQYKYSSDAVLLVFASEHYDPDDYIREYGEFLTLKGLK